MWPQVQASIARDELTITFSAGEDDDLDGAVATCASQDVALALAQYFNCRVRYT